MCTITDEPNPLKNSCMGPDFKLLQDSDFLNPPYSYLANLTTDDPDHTTGFGACKDIACRCQNKGCDITKTIDHSDQTGLIKTDPCDPKCDDIGCTTCNCYPQATCCNMKNADPICCLLKDGCGGCIALSELLPRCGLGSTCEPNFVCK